MQVMLGLRKIAMLAIRLRLFGTSAMASIARSRGKSAQAVVSWPFGTRSLACASLAGNSDGGNRKMAFRHIFAGLRHSGNRFMKDR